MAGGTNTGWENVIETQVKAILEKKGNRVVAVDAKASVYEAIGKMVENKVGAVFVMERDEVVGIFTERDLLRLGGKPGFAPQDTPIDRVMTREVVFVRPTHTTGDCLALMTERKCRHLPVMDGSKVAGMISIGDCVKQVAEDAHVVVRVLTEFIANKYPG